MLCVRERVNDRTKKKYKRAELERRKFHEPKLKFRWRNLIFTFYFSKNESNIWNIFASFLETNFDMMGNVTSVFFKMII